MLPGNAAIATEASKDFGANHGRSKVELRVYRKIRAGSGG